MSADPDDPVGHLIITRRPGEALVIDERIRVEIVSVEGHKVRIGLRAPKSVSIARSELVDPPES